MSFNARRAHLPSASEATAEAPTGADGLAQRANRCRASVRLVRQLLERTANEAANGSGARLDAEDLEACIVALAGAEADAFAIWNGDRPDRQISSVVDGGRR